MRFFSSRSLSAILPLTLSALLSLALAVPAAAQGPDVVADFADALDFREIGPTIMGGRVADLAVVETDPATFYVATASGGVWKTVNAGVTFEPVFDDQTTASIGDVTVAPSNANVVWVGTGEPQNRQSSPWGNGVYRSTDAGRTWSRLGLEDTHHIGRIQVHPRDPDVAWVAAVGHLWGPNAERGVFKTTDGGESWEKVLFIDELTGAIDLAMDPNDPQTLFAAMYQRQRKPWGFNGGGPGSGIYRTVDGGQTWVELTQGLPDGHMGRIGVHVFRGDGNFVCAIVEADPIGAEDAPEPAAERNGVYCSTDRGETWEHRSTTNNRPMYYSQIWIDPNDPQRIYLGGRDLFLSSDGGYEFTDQAAAGVHLDHHALWIDPANSEHLLLGSDGGVSVSWDGSEHWYQFRNLPIAQFYEIGVDTRDPYHVCGGLQDNGSWCAPSDTWSDQGIRTRDWYNVAGGDGFFTVMHTSDPSLMFAESQGGNLRRIDLGTFESARIRPIGRPGDDAEMPELRWNWNAPVVLSSHDDSTLYAGSDRLFRSADLGHSFEAISEDLSWGVDRDTLTIMGVPGSDPQMSRNDGQASYGNLTAIAESPLDADVLYTGTDDGRVHVTRDAGATWNDVTENIDGLPPFTYVTRIVASHGDVGTVIAAFDGHRNDDFRPYVFVSYDYGEEWSPITGGLPMTSVNALAQHPDNPRLLFLGNEVGLYVLTGFDQRWVRMRSNLPTVPVDDIEIHPRDNDLIVGTHGRGIWILSDIAPLEELDETVLSSNAYVFSIRRATSYNRYEPQGWTPGIYEAENPEAGALIRYYLSTDPDELQLRVTDATGNEVRVLEAPSTAGLHEVIWDLRLVEEDANGDAMDPGPRVLPGVYIVEISTPLDVVQRELTVRLDPRVGLGRRELMARHEAMLDSYRLTGPVEASEEALSEMNARLDEVDELIEDRGGVEVIRAEVDSLRATLDELTEELDEASAGADMWSRIEGMSDMPTADALFQIDRSWSRVPDVIDRIEQLRGGRYRSLLGRVYTDAVLPDIAALPVPRRGR